MLSIVPKTTNLYRGARTTDGTAYASKIERREVVERVLELRGPRPDAGFDWGNLGTWADSRADAERAARSPALSRTLARQSMLAGQDIASADAFLRTEDTRGGRSGAAIAIKSGGEIRSGGSVTRPSRPSGADAKGADIASARRPCISTTGAESESAPERAALFPSEKLESTPSGSNCSVQTATSSITKDRGATNLALAILADVLGDDERARKLHQAFKWAAIAPLKHDEPWEISAEQVLAWVAKWERGEEAYLA